MPARRIKSIFHGHPKEARVWHREHRSHRGRNPRMKDSKEWRQLKEKRLREETDRQIKFINL